MPMKKFGCYNNVLVVTCALIQFTQVYLFSTKCASEDVVKTLVEPGFKDNGAHKGDFLTLGRTLPVKYRLAQAIAKGSQRASSHRRALHSHQHVNVRTKYSDNA